MKKLAFLALVALLFVGCAPSARSVSSFSGVYPLNAETVLVATTAPQKFVGFANDVSGKVAASLKARGVNAEVYLQKDVPEMGGNPIMDAAKARGASCVLIQVFTMLSASDTDKEKFNEEVSLFSLKEKRILWKASVTWNKAVDFNAAAQGASGEVVDRLYKDGFIPAARP